MVVVELLLVVVCQVFSLGVASNPGLPRSFFSQPWKKSLLRKNRREAIFSMAAKKTAWKAWVQGYPRCVCWYLHGIRVNSVLYAWLTCEFCFV